MNPADADLLAAMMRAAAANRQALLTILDSRCPTDRKVSDLSDTLSDLASYEACRAADYLVRLVLSTDPDLDPGNVDGAEKYHCAPRAVVVDGVAYLAVPDENLDGITPSYREHENDDQTIMFLVVMPASNITDLGGVAPIQPSNRERINLPVVPFGVQSRN